MVMAHSMGVISLRITSSVSSSGQWATKLRMATKKGTVVLVRIVSANITEPVQVIQGGVCVCVFLTTQCSSSALQCDLPGEGVSSGLFCLQLLLGARKHVPPQQQHLGKVIAHEGWTWAQTQCGDNVVSDRDEDSFITDESKPRDKREMSRSSPRVMRAPSSSHPA